MRRTSHRTVLIAISGTAGNRSAEKKAAIIFYLRKSRIETAGRETVGYAPMGNILHVSGIVCRKSS